MYWLGLILFPLLAMILSRRARPEKRTYGLGLGYLILITGGILGLHRFYLKSMLGLIYLPTYIMAMLVTELTTAITTHPFLFVMLKYVLGTGHHSLVPLAIIAIRRDLRDLIKVSDNTVIH